MFISKIATVVGIVGGVKSLINSGDAADAASDSAQAQKDTAQSQLVISEKQLAMMQDQWDTYKKTFLPVGQKLVDTAMN
ncbi:MAG: hypothetical protein NUV75_11385, partial [Gallionella sp.]|nr:hypothetical protein [Gallionella sp.]